MLPNISCYICFETKNQGAPILHKLKVSFAFEDGRVSTPCSRHVKTTMNTCYSTSCAVMGALKKIVDPVIFKFTIELPGTLSVIK